MLAPAHSGSGPNALGVPRRNGRSRDVIAALILREMTTTYGRNPGGWLWALVEPTAAIALLAFAFSLIFRDPPLGREFALFYASGFLPYMVFHDISGKVAGALRFSKPLFAFGRVTVVDAIVARVILNALTHLAIGVIVLGALIHLSRHAGLPDLPLVALAYVLALALAVGFGVVNCYLFMAFPAWERLWAIAMRPLFIVSGVVFLLEDVPFQFQGVLLANPLFHVTGIMRQGVYVTYAPMYPSVTFVLALSAALLVLGLLLLRAFGDELLQK